MDWCLMSQRAPADSRPGRPAAKRLPLGLGLPAALQGHPQLKKHRLENGDFVPFENGHLGGSDKSPLLANGYNAPPSHLQAMQQLYQHPLLSPNLPPLPPGGGGGGSAHPHQQPHPTLHPSLPPKPPAGIPGMDAIANWENNCRAAYDGILKQIERMQQERGEVEAEALDSRARDLSSHNGPSNGHSPVLNLSKGGVGSGSPGSDNSDSDPGASDKDDDEDDNISNPEDDDEPRPTDLTDASSASARAGNSPMASSPPPYGSGSTLVAASVGPTALELASGTGANARADSDEEGGGSLLGTTALLRNIQRLLKVAAENARAQEQQVDMDRAELKMDVVRERELKESLGRQLVDETRTRILWQKRLQKERKARRRLQEQLELEMKRRAQLEEALRGGNDARDLDLKPAEPKPDSAVPPDPALLPPHQKQQGPSPSPQSSHNHLQQQQQIQLLQQQQLAKSQQTSPPDRERHSPAVLDSRPNFYKNSMLFGGAS